MKSSFRKLFSGIAGLLAIGVAIIALNVIVARLGVRADLTAEKLYTLSDGSRKAVSDMPEPVTIKYFFSRSLPAVDVYIKTYATQVENLLKEYTEAAAGKIILEINDPEPDSDEEEWAVQYGIEPQRVSMESPPMYFGLVVISADGKTEIAIPGFSPRTESTLEYDITRAITRTVNPIKPVIGVITPLPAFGESNPLMRGRGDRSWYSFMELGRDADVRQIPVDTDKIPENIRVLVLVHPKNLSDTTMFAIDQFVLSGGHLMVFADPFSITDAIEASKVGNSMQQSFSSSPEKLFKAWGVEFDPSMVVADMKYQTRLQGATGPEENITFLSLGKSAFSDDILVSQWGSIIMPFAGAFVFTETNTLSVTPLITLDENSGLVSSMAVRMGTDALRSQFRPAGRKLVLAARLTGEFRTAFPDGAPTEPDVTNTPPKSVALKKGESSVLLFADSDMLQDDVCVRINSMMGLSIPSIISDNMNLFASAAEQLAGDSALLSVRARGRTLRPFTVVDELERKARLEYLDREKALVEKLHETQARLDELQNSKTSQQQMILSSEQREEIARFREEQRKVSHELKAVRRNLNKDIEALGRKVKSINIVAVPLFVAIFGIVYGLRRRRG